MRNGSLERMVGGEVDVNSIKGGGCRRILWFDIVEGGLAFGRCAAAEKNVIAGGGNGRET